MRFFSGSTPGLDELLLHPSWGAGSELLPLEGQAPPPLGLQGSFSASCWSELRKTGSIGVGSAQGRDTDHLGLPVWRRHHHPSCDLGHTGMGGHSSTSQKPLQVPWRPSLTLPALLTPLSVVFQGAKGNMGEPGEPGQKGRQVCAPPRPPADPVPGARAGPTARCFLHRETPASKAQLDSQDLRQVATSPDASWDMDTSGRWSGRAG